MREWINEGGKQTFSVVRHDQHVNNVFLYNGTDFIFIELSELIDRKRL